MRRTLWITLLVALVALTVVVLNFGGDGFFGGGESSVDLETDQSESLPGQEFDSEGKRRKVADPAPHKANKPDSKKRSSKAGYGSLVVKVVGAGSRPRRNGRRLAGIRVLLRRGGSADGWSPGREAVTDKKGLVRFRDVAAGPVRVRTGAGGQAATYVFPGRENGVTIRVALGLTVVGNVETAGGQAVARASIWLSESSRVDRGMIVAQSAADGSFRIENVTGRPWLCAFHDEYQASGQHRILGSEGETVRLRVQIGGSTASLTGFVMDARGPVTEAVIAVGIDPSWDHRAEDGTWVPGPPPRRTRTDQNGRFAIAGLTPGVSLLRVFSGDHALYRKPLHLTEGTSEVQVMLRPGGVVRGVVKTARHRRVEGAHIGLADMRGFGTRFVLSDAEGRFLLRGLPTGSEVRLRARNYARGVDETKLALAEGVETEWNPVLTRGKAADTGPNANGQLIDHHGRPLHDWLVVAIPMKSSPLGRRVTRTKKGDFHIPTTADERLRLEVQPFAKFRDFPWYSRRDVGLLGKVVVQVPDPQFHNGRLVAEVTDAAGRPLAAKLQIVHQDLELWRQFHNNPKTGKFEVFPVPPGKLTMKLCCHGQPWKKLGEKTMTAGGTLDLGRIEMGQLVSVLHGRLSRRDGRVLGKVRMRLTDEDYSEPAVISVTGKGYRSGPLPRGKTYKLRIQGKGVAAQVRDVALTTAGEQRFDLVLDPGHRRRLEFKLAAGQPKPKHLGVIVTRIPEKTGGKWVQVWHSNIETLEEEVWLAPGRYVMSGFHHPDWGARATVEVKNVQDDSKIVLQFLKHKRGQ